MPYEAAINKAWGDLAALNPPQVITAKFLSDEYSVDTDSKKIVSFSCKAPAKDFYAILILHYLVSRLRGLPALTGEWLDFKEISGLEGYAGAFRERCIAPVIRKYGAHPAHLFGAFEKLPARQAQKGDAGIIIEAFEGVEVLVILWGGDEEFGPEANMLFDRSITKIFCTEDIVVLGQIITHSL